MNRKILLLSSALGFSLGCLTTLANDIEPGKEFYNAYRILNKVVIDGVLSEWTGLPVLSDPKFSTPEPTTPDHCAAPSGNYVLFEQYSGGIWTGPDDQTSAVQVAWDADNVYFGFVVTDDYHENAARSAWNGDSIQLMIANDARDTQIALYNYALGGIETDANLNDVANVITNHEAGPGGTGAIVRRDTNTHKTIYEIILPAASLGLTAPLTAGTKFGLGMAINDGDATLPGQASQAGQKGWGGLGAHAIVFGKDPCQTALVTLVTNTPGVELFFLSAINPGFTNFTFRATDKGTSIVDPTSAKLILNNQARTLTPSPKVGDATDFTYNYASRLAAGSSNTYSIEIKDTLGHAITNSGNFILPTGYFPSTNLPSLAVANKAWRIRMIWGAGTIDSIPSALAAIQQAADPGFAGGKYDFTNAVVNYGTGGLFGNNLPYPDPVIMDPSGLWTGDDFVQFSVGNLDIPAEGDYTFGFHSDDGFAFRIRGGQAVAVSGNGQLDPADPEAVVHPANTGDSSTRGVYHLKKGVYRTEFFWWERGGGDFGEIYAAKGRFANDADTDQWRLVGDNVPSQQFIKLGVDTNGWSVISSDPGGDPLNSWADATLDLAATGGGAKKYDSLDVGDPETNAGTQAFPKNTTADDNDYALKANATLVVPATGTYVIGFNSDDGAYVRIAGQTFSNIIANATGSSVIDDGGSGKPDRVICDCLTGDSATTASINLAQGTYPIEAGMFERGGGSFLRVRGAQLGSPQLPVLAKGGAGSFSTGEAIHLTDSPTNIVAGIVLAFTRTGNSLNISWTPTGGTLESTPSLGGTPTWTSVGTANPATVNIGAGNLFLRVRQ